MSDQEREALTAEQRASLEAAWVKAKRSNWPGEYDGFEAGYRAALAAREEPRVTHGRHCPCSACAAEDWTRPELAACGMHGPSCPAIYAPLNDDGVST